MGKIFYAEKSIYSSENAIKRILLEFYEIKNATILRTKNGKPYVESTPFFSVSNTEKMLFIAFSSANVGLDAELLSRKPNYDSIVKKFHKDEREEITCAEEFLKHWVVKESAVKYLGGTLAHDLSKLVFVNDRLLYNGAELPVKLNFFNLEEHLICVCGEEDFSKAEFIRLTSL